MPDKPKKALRLSRKEGEIVKAYEEHLLEFGRVHHDDPREQIYHDIVVSKFGSYDMGGERMTPTPLWDFVFDKKLCPACNTPVDMVKDEAISKLEKKEDNYVCSNCKFEIPEGLFDMAYERNRKESEWLKKDSELREKMGGAKPGKKRIRELAELGEQKAITKFERLLKGEKT